MIDETVDRVVRELREHAVEGGVSLQPYTSRELAYIIDQQATRIARLARDAETEQRRIAALRAEIEMQRKLIYRLRAERIEEVEALPVSSTNITLDDVNDFGWTSADPSDLSVTLASMCAQLNLIGHLLVDIRDRTGAEAALAATKEGE